MDNKNDRKIISILRPLLKEIYEDGRRAAMDDLEKAISVRKGPKQVLRHCPVPGCKNGWTPMYGGYCKAHKDQRPIAAVAPPAAPKKKAAKG